MACRKATQLVGLFSPFQCRFRSGISQRPEMFDYERVIPWRTMKITSNNHVYYSPPMTIDHHYILAIIWTTHNHYINHSILTTISTTLYQPLYFNDSIPVVPGTRRGRSVEHRKMTIRNQSPIQKSLGCRSNELLQLWGASTNEHMVVEMRMKWHERVHAQLTEGANSPMNQWTNERVN